MCTRLILCLGLSCAAAGLPLHECAAASPREHSAFFERHIRPILIEHCYECHSEEAQERQGGLLLDRRAGWLKGGDTQMAVVPGNPESSLLIKAVRYADEDLQMPPDGQLEPEQIALLEQWVRRGAPGPHEDLHESEFSRLGDQDYLFQQARQHWAFQPVQVHEPPAADDPNWNRQPIDRFVYAGLAAGELTPSPRADARTLTRRLSFDLTGLPPAPTAITRLPDDNDEAAYRRLVDQLLDSPAFGEHMARMWLDVARYADTDSFYRPDTRTPHYFPFAFTYRDYVIQAFNADKPFDQFVREQLAADLLGVESNAPELAALGFLTVGPHANRNATEALDDWIDVTTRGLLGITAACARCHDHKYEPVPTADYYALRSVFNSVIRVSPLDEQNLPTLPGYDATAADVADYQKKRAAIDAKITKAGGAKSKNNNRSVAQKIRETELAELLLFHPGAPARTMIVQERRKAPAAYIFLRGDPARRGDLVQHRFLQVLDAEQQVFSQTTSGRLELADKIVDPANPLTARVFVNRVWGWLMGSHLVDTPSDFGLQGSPPTHPELLDWLAHDFVAHQWSVKHLVRTIVSSATYQQASRHRPEMAAIDPQNRQLWRANRKRLSIESLRDSLLAVSGQLDRNMFGRPAPLWGDNYTRRRSLYGYINRFNLDPTLRAFDFPTPMQSQGQRRESIVAPQALFTMNAPFVIEQAVAATETESFLAGDTDADRVLALFQSILQRAPQPPEVARIVRFVSSQERQFQASPPGGQIASPWPLVAQSLMMSTEFQYVD